MTAQVFIITRAESGRTLAYVLHARLRLSWSQTRRLVQENRVRLGGSACLDAARRVKPGQRLEVSPARKNAGRRAGDAQAPRGKVRKPTRKTASYRLPEG